jgi:hypothetical protein
MALLQKVDGGEPDAPGAVALDAVLTSSNAKLVYDCAQLVDLWLPHYFLDEAGSRRLVGAKNYRRMGPLTGTDFPTVVPNMFGTRTGLLAGATTSVIGDLADVGEFMPVSRSFSVVCGCQPNIPAGTSQYPWGTNGSPATYCWITSAGNVRAYFQGVLHLNSSMTVPGNAPHVHVLSYSHHATAASRVSTLRVNKTLAATKVNVPDGEVNVNSSFQMLGYGAGGTAASASMRLGPVMLFDGLSLTDAGNEPLLAAAEGLAYALTGMT